MSGPNAVLSAIYGKEYVADPLEKVASGHLTVADLATLPSETLLKIARGQNIMEPAPDSDNEELEKFAAFDHVGRALAAEFAESLIKTAEEEKKQEEEASMTPGDRLIARMKAKKNEEEKGEKKEGKEEGKEE